MNCYFPYQSGFEGQKEIINKSNSSLSILTHFRVIQRESARPTELSTDGKESVLMCVKGKALVKIDRSSFDLGLLDAVYVPRNKTCRIISSKGAELLGGSAPSELDREPALSRFVDVDNDPVRHFLRGDPEKGTFRNYYSHFGRDFQASRILLGFAKIRAGNWSSWPPHEHCSSLEEVYIYFDMPSPAFIVQMVYQDMRKPFFCGVVNEGDAVVVSDGYHPCIAAPGSSASYVYILAGKELDDRTRTSQPNIQPEFL